MSESGNDEGFDFAGRQREIRPALGEADIGLEQVIADDDPERGQGR
jgi:hypothetical protein